jgi:hypothetical protein
MYDSNYEEIMEKADHQLSSLQTVLANNERDNKKKFEEDYEVVVIPVAPTIQLLNKKGKIHNSGGTNQYPQAAPVQYPE